MASLLQFGRKENVSPSSPSAEVSDFLRGFSIEVMPRTAAKIEDFRAILPVGTRVYIAHIEGTPIEDEDHLSEEKRMALLRVGAATSRLGVVLALLLAGGVTKPAGDFHSSMQLMETGLFDAHGFKRLHVAGHPEGNKDIDPDGSDAQVMEALRWKTDFANRTDADMAIATQFAFEPDPVIAWADRLKAEGIDLPIHIGIAGPAKLQTMIKFACTDAPCQGSHQAVASLYT